VPRADSRDLLTFLALLGRERCHYGAYSSPGEVVELAATAWATSCRSRLMILVRRRARLLWAGQWMTGTAAAAVHVADTQVALEFKVAGGALFRATLW